MRSGTRDSECDPGREHSAMRTSEDGLLLEREQCSPGVPSIEHLTAIVRRVKAFQGEQAAEGP